jgi:hypothetical protein
MLIVQNISNLWLDFITNLPDIMICVQTQRINIAPNTAPKKGWLLRNDAEFHPKVL